MSKYRNETKIVPTDFSTVVEGLPLSMMQIEQQNKEIRRAEELITSVINQLDKDQIGKVLTFVSGSRDPDAPSLFQIANVDSGEIRWIHGVEVTEIVAEYRTTIKKPSSLYDQIQLQQQ